jgi:hypothetical protein
MPAMAIYTFQRLIDSGNWAPPQSDEVSHSSSLPGLRNSLENWRETVERMDDPSLCSLMVWKGKLEDVTDQYPDFILKAGPRGGIIKELC